MNARSNDLIWRLNGGADSHSRHLICDLSGHFWAKVELRDDGRWWFVVWDYQGNAMLKGDASTQEGAQAAVDGWNGWVVTAAEDPSQDWDGGDLS